VGNEHRVALVTGASRGIGRGIVLELARAGGYHLAINYATNEAAARETHAACQEAAAAAGHRLSAEIVRGDVSAAADRQGLIEAVAARFGRLDLLVNNAGGQFMSPAEAISPKGFRTVIELNVQGTWLMTHAAATRAFIPQKGGKVVSVTLTPHNGMPGMVHSGAARAAVENMMRTLAIEWARFNIKLCAVAAGQFETEVLRTKYPKVVADNVSRTVPLQRLGQPEEMAWLIAFLASPAADFVSGAVLSIDGARDNWFGPWPPPGMADESGTPVAEERRSRD
jgi:citronellol/citronellal dehydrogenase